MSRREQDEPGRKPPRSSIVARCQARGLRMTGQRRVIARVLEDAADHPDAEELHARASAIDPNISLATVYRTVRLFEEHRILDRLEFGDGRARYEDAARAHHDHLFDMDSGEVIEFVDPEIEALQEKIARRLGYRLIGHRMELFGVPLQKDEKKDETGRGGGGRGAGRNARTAGEGRGAGGDDGKGDGKGGRA